MLDATIIQKLVINRSPAGFRLSPQALWAIGSRKGRQLFAPAEDATIPFEDESLLHPYRGDDLARTDPDLVAVVERLGAEANGDGADLVVIEVEVMIRIVHTEAGEHVAVYGKPRLET
jgi:hypothetical protein